ncbi:MAG TPA: choice-of-anchor Q domain-containing protein, partial [Rudaea sp.]
GGINAAAITLKRSTVSGNHALSVHNAPAHGGGVWGGTVLIDYSTIAGNKADSAGGGVVSRQYLAMTNSTVSGNTTSNLGVIAGIYAVNSAQIFNSTIAGNVSGTGVAAGLYVRKTAISQFILSSTVIAGNSVQGIPLDLGVSGNLVVNGSKNFIGAVQNGTAMPADTLFGDPRLGPLANNGGPTLTHAPLRGSLLIDHGTSDPRLTRDQRGLARVQGAMTDIGAVESDFLFANGFEAR